MVELKVVRQFDPWNSPLCTCPRKYSLHPYTGCSHFCLYCYATSYIGRKPSMPKKHFLRRLKHDLSRINKSLVIEMSTSSDPYPPIESWMMLTRKTLELLVKHRVKILITTKSNIVARDADLLLKTPSAIMLTITTINDEIARKLEPGAPPPSKRIATIKELAAKKLPVGVRIDPIIPGLNDDPQEIKELIEEIADAGAKHIVTSTYKLRWDSFRRMTAEFPELEKYLRKLYIEQGERIHGYIYLPKNIRAKLLRPAIDYGLRKGLTVATCREGLGQDYFRALSCDGTHLIHIHPLINKK